MNRGECAFTGFPIQSKSHSIEIKQSFVCGVDMASASISRRTIESSNQMTVAFPNAYPLRLKIFFSDPQMITAINSDALRMMHELWIVRAGGNGTRFPNGP